MRIFLIFLLCLPMVASAQKTDSLTNHKKQGERRKPLGFVHAGLMSEQWVLTSNLPSGYSGVTYGGSGYFIGGGFKSRTDDQKPLGFGLAVDYLGYNMNKTLKTDQLVQTNYSFLRLSPAVYLQFKTRSKLSFQACANAALLVPAQSKENSYLQFGLKGILGYKDYGLSLGYNFAQGSNTPNTDINVNKWGEHSIAIGIIFYPANLLKQLKTPKTAPPASPVPGKK